MGFRWSRAIASALASLDGVVQTLSAENQSLQSKMGDITALQTRLAEADAERGQLYRRLTAAEANQVQNADKVASKMAYITIITRYGCVYY